MTASSHAHTHAAGEVCGHDHTASRAVDATALISGRGLTLMRGRRSVLDGVDIDIHDGEIVTLIGPNGAGKTTLVRVLLGLERPSSGELVKRADVCIGYVPQRFDVDAAMPLTVERFLTLGQAALEHQIVRALDEVGAGHVRDRQLSRISGGELQRVVLARALMREPKLLVLDEPVRGVDFAGETELYALIGRVRDGRGCGVLLVSHDLHVVMASSDRVLCLNRHLCCSGVPEKVAQDPEYARLFGAEAARALAVYHHHHDHAHDLDGAPVSAPRGHSEEGATGRIGLSHGASPSSLFRKVRSRR